MEITIINWHALPFALNSEFENGSADVKKGETYMYDMEYMALYEEMENWKGGLNKAGWEFEWWIDDPKCHTVYYRLCFKPLVIKRAVPRDTIERAIEADVRDLIVDMARTIISSLEEKYEVTFNAEVIPNYVTAEVVSHMKHKTYDKEFRLCSYACLWNDVERFLLTAWLDEHLVRYTKMEEN